MIIVPEFLQRSREFVQTGVTLVREDNIEESFFNFYVENRFKNPYRGSREYLPIFWTDYYYRNGFSKGDHSTLQQFLDGLDREKKYFTVCAYDDGIINDIKDLDLLIFSSFGKGDVTIPCLQYHIYLNDLPKQRRVCARGSDTHPIRREIPGWNFEIIDIDRYVVECAESEFTFCPRGYGITSFRLYEAITLGSVPVYIWEDEMCLPYMNEIHWYKLCIFLKANRREYLWKGLDERMNDFDIKEFHRYRKEIQNKYFTFNAVNKYIYEWRGIRD